jgi:hypothetical protein
MRGSRKLLKLALFSPIGWLADVSCIERLILALPEGWDHVPLEDNKTPNRVVDRKRQGLFG